MPFWISSSATVSLLILSGVGRYAVAESGYTPSKSGLFRRGKRGRGGLSLLEYALLTLIAEAGRVQRMTSFVSLTGGSKRESLISLEASCSHYFMVILSQSIFLVEALWP